MLKNQEKYLIFSYFFINFDCKNAKLLIWQINFRQNLDSKLGLFENEIIYKLINVIWLKICSQKINKNNLKNKFKKTKLKYETEFLQKVSEKFKMRKENIDQPLKMQKISFSYL